MEDDIDMDTLEGIGEDGLMDILCHIDFNENIEDTDKIDDNVCPSCNAKDTLFDDFSGGHIVCSNCGQVTGEIIDKNPEWNNYGDDSKGDMGRCSMPTNPLNATVGTSISGSYRTKLHMLHNWSALTYKNRNLYQVFNFISDKCRAGGIMKCIEDDAKIMYKNVYECRHQTGDNKNRPIITRGNNRKSLIAACVYYACRRKHKTRSPKEIASLFNLDYTDVTKGCKNFLDLIKMKNIDVRIDVNQPEDYVPRYCKYLKIKGGMVDDAIKLAKNVRRLNIATKHTPLSIATACILIVAEMNDLTINKKAISEKINVSEVTITKTYKSIEKNKYLLLDDKKVEKALIRIQTQRKHMTRPPLLEKMYKESNRTHDDAGKDKDKDYSNLSNYDPKIDDIRDFIFEITSEEYDKMDNIDKKYHEVIKQHHEFINRDAKKKQKCKQVKSY